MALPPSTPIKLSERLRSVIALAASTAATALAPSSRSWLSVRSRLVTALAGSPALTALVPSTRSMLTARLSVWSAALPLSPSASAMPPSTPTLHKQQLLRLSSWRPAAAAQLSAALSSRMLLRSPPSCVQLLAARSSAVSVGVMARLSAASPGGPILRAPRSVAFRLCASGASGGRTHSSAHIPCTTSMGTSLPTLSDRESLIGPSELTSSSTVVGLPYPPVPRTTATSASARSPFGQLASSSAISTASLMAAPSGELSL
mmetsp:Transcript_74744/g.206145  ORF Transcript_74744/g.206145 Transcript_74744/m.206145 type:complete len:260 (+) Transcript_74744:1030-1809(+)